MRGLKVKKFRKIVRLLIKEKFEQMTFKERVNFIFKKQIVLQNNKKKEKKGKKQ